MAKIVSRSFLMYDLDKALDDVVDDDSYLEVLEDRITCKDRRGTNHSAILKELESGKCYMLNYSETVDGDRIYPMNSKGIVEVTEVEPVEVVTIKFRPVQV